MSIPFVRFGESADAILRALGSSPTDIINHLHDELIQAFFVTGNTLPDYHNPTIPTELLAAQNHGVGQFGQWRKRRRNPRKFASDSKAVVHWPTLIRDAYDLAFSNPSLAFFFYSFLPLIRLRSPFLAEALHRNYVKSLHRYAENSGSRLKQSDASQVDVNEGESITAEALCYHLSTDKDFIAALQHSCSLTYAQIPPRKERFRMAAIRGAYPKDYNQDSSLLYVGASDKCAPQLVMPSPGTLPSKSFGSPRTPALLTELFVAHDLAKTWAKPPGWQKDYLENQVRTLGIAILPAAPGGVLFINWERWFQYRLSLRDVAVYKEAVASLPDFSRLARNPITAQFAPILSEVFFQKYRSIYLHPTAFPRHTQKLEEEWGAGYSSQTVSAFSIKEMLSLRGRIRKMGETVAALSEPIPTRKYEMTPLYLDFPILVNGESVSCRAVHTGRKVWFIPPWKMTDALIFKNPNVVGDAWDQKNLHKGVIKLPDTGELAFSLPYLGNRTNCPSAPSDPEVLEQIRIFASNAKRAIFVKPEIKKEPSGAPRSRPFTKEEDHTITTLYRPGLTEEVKQKIADVCRDRNWTSISRRARQLRRRLIDRGVYNIDSLPHGRYNHKILREIATAREVREKRNG